MFDRRSFLCSLATPCFAASDTASPCIFETDNTVLRDKYNAAVAGLPSPAMLAVTDFVSRLYGVRIGPDSVESNCRLQEGSRSTRFAIRTAQGGAELIQDSSGAQLIWNRRAIRNVSGAVLVITDFRGRAIRMIGTGSAAGAHGIQPDQVVEP